VSHDDVTAPLVGEGVRRAYPPGSLVFAEGDPPGPTMVVTTGTVAVSTVAGGQIDAVGAGELVGELSALDGLPRSASVHAVTHVELRAIAPARFAELLGRHPELARHVRSVLDARRPLGDITRGPVGQGVPVDRLARWVLEQPVDGDGWLGVSLDDMAEGLDTSRELLSRAIDHLVGRGAVALDRGRLLVRSCPILERLADPPD
jgi:CRP/FNR family cyclic AMP-dependent transcriptional regulator